MSSRLPRFAAALSLLSLCAVFALRAQADASVSVDFNAAHNFQGIGAQMWTKRGAAQQEAQLLRDMNAQFVRVSVEPETKHEQIPTGQSVERYYQIISSAVTPNLQRNIADFRGIIEPLHIKPHLVFWHMPEEWMQVQAGKKAGSKKEAHKAVDERIPDYANLLTAELMWVTRQGIQPYAVELTNEPQGAWDTKYTPEQYADLVIDTRKALDAHGLQGVRIEGPGTGVRNFPEFVQGLRARNALKDLAFITAHAYQTPQQMDDPSTAGYAEFMGRGQFGEIVMTEFGVKKHNEDEPGLASVDLDVGSHEYGLATGAESLKLLGKGASSVIYWQLQDFDFSKKKHGALDEGGRRHPVAFALQALFGHIPAPARTVAGVGGPGDVPVEGFIANGRVWLSVANLSNAPQQVNVRIGGASVHGVGAIDGFANGNLANNVVTGAAVRGSTFTATIAPRSLATVALQ